MRFIPDLRLNHPFHQTLAPLPSSCPPRYLPWHIWSFPIHLLRRITAPATMEYTRWDQEVRAVSRWRPKQPLNRTTCCLIVVPRSRFQRHKNIKFPPPGFCGAYLSSFSSGNKMRRMPPWLWTSAVKNNDTPTLMFRFRLVVLNKNTHHTRH